MNKKFIKVVSGIVVGLVFVLGGTRLSWAFPRNFQSDKGEFEYTVKTERNGSVAVILHPKAQDAVGREKFKRANQQRVDEISKLADSIPIQITFRSPISIEQAKVLVAKYEVRVKTFAMVGRTEVNSEKGSTFVNGSLDEPVEMRSSFHDASGNLAPNQLVLQGVMVIQGELKNPVHLRQLSDSPEVYLADTSEYEVRRLLLRDHASQVLGREISVMAETPFWDLDW